MINERKIGRKIYWFSYFNGLQMKGKRRSFLNKCIMLIFSYIESARQLEHETNLDVSKYDVCDNVDLHTILQEYE